MKRLLLVLCVLPLLLLGGCQGLDRVLNLNSTVTAKKKTTYNPENLKRLKETNQCPNCVLREANLYFANLQSANLRGVNLEDAMLRHANHSGANLIGTNLQGAKLDPEGVRIAKASGALNVFDAVVVAKKTPRVIPSPTVTAKKTTTYNNGHLMRLIKRNKCPRCDLQGADLRYANLQGADLRGADLYGTNLQGVNLRRASLYYTKLQGANLREANLEGANLEGANLSLANLKGANLLGANLRRASLYYTNLLGAFLYGADLEGAKLDPEGIQIAKASGALNVPEPFVTANKPSPTVIGTSEKTPKVTPKRNVYRAPSVIGTSEKTPKVTPKTKPKPPVVAKVTPKKTKPKSPAQSISASGFFVSRFGHVITNEHVVRGCKLVTVGDNAKKQSPVTVEETDRRNDLALLKLSTLTMASAETKSLIRKLGIKVVPLASDGLLRSEDVQLGEEVMVAGYPYGDIFSNTIKVTGGMVSAVRGMGDDSGQFQLDAAVQPGNSGGPIYDANGNIVGVVVSQLDRLKVAKRIGSLPENVNFGIKASTVRQFLTSSGLPTKWSTRSKSMSKIELAKIAQKQTLMVMCHQ